MTEIVETYQFGPDLVVDEQAGMIRNCKVLGGKSLNGRTYSDSVMREAVSLYEGAKVNLNHDLGPRNFEDRFGRLTKTRFVEGDGIRADLQFNIHHPAAKPFIWWAKNDPRGIGLSHQVFGRSSRQDDGTEMVEKIEEVRSVDIVADPATTNGLFESQRKEMPEMSIKELTVEQLAKERPDLVKALTERQVNQDELQKLRQQNKDLSEQIGKVQAEQKQAKKEADRLKMAEEAGLKAEKMTDVFRRILMSADDSDVAQLIDDRVLLIGHHQESDEEPVSSRKTEGADKTGDRPWSEQDSQSFINSFRRFRTG